MDGQGGVTFLAGTGHQNHQRAFGLELLQIAAAKQASIVAVVGIPDFDVHGQFLRRREPILLATVVNAHQPCTRTC